ncbi:energy transducer TonB [uncultured Bacteroides sp.]|uniref:energy transducer TonB n=1 Tax=uncultured Bacteroides sp. TaxID=162156 RepID=UPI002AAA8F8B|nr:energy transducer TonB [uncultured Bacteroides sp.]
MEIKKMPKLDLERKRPIGLLIGFTIALILLFAAFQVNIPKLSADNRIANVAVEEEMVPITVQEERRVPLLSKLEETRLPLPSTNNYAQQVEEMDNSYATEEPKTIIVTSHYSIQYTQQEEPEKEENVQLTEYQPEFPGGEAALLEYLRRKVNYPVAAQESGIQGRVIVQFAINRDGSVSDPVVLRSVCPVLDKEAIRVISSMPRWRPGMQGGRTVRAIYTIPVSFKLKY